MTEPLLSDLQERKLHRAFVHLDVDGDGRVERDDVLALAARILVGFDEATTSGKGKRLVETIEALWDVLLEAVGRGPDGGLSADDLATAVAIAFVHGDRGDDVLVPAAEAIARLCDTDGDGRVVTSDLRTLHEAFDLAPGAAVMAMGHLDPAGAGHVTVDDLARALCEYYVGDDPSAPGTWLFGTLDPTPTDTPGARGRADVGPVASRSVSPGGQVSAGGRVPSADAHDARGPVDAGSSRSVSSGGRGPSASLPVAGDAPRARGRENVGPVASRSVSASGQTHPGRVSSADAQEARGPADVGPGVGRSVSSDGPGRSAGLSAAGEAPGGTRSPVDAGSGPSVSPGGGGPVGGRVRSGGAHDARGPVAAGGRGAVGGGSVEVGSGGGGGVGVGDGGRGAAGERSRGSEP